MTQLIQHLILALSTLRIPVGTSDERPTTLKAGQIRYNTTNDQFEGYNTTDSWQGLGGVIDIDQDTKIVAEANPLDDNGNADVSAGNERMKVDANGNVQLVDSDPTFVPRYWSLSALQFLLVPAMKDRPR